MTGKQTVQLVDLIKEIVVDVGHFVKPGYGSYQMSPGASNTSLSVSVLDPSDHGFGSNDGAYAIYIDNIENTAILNIGHFGVFNFNESDSILLFKAALMQVRSLVAIELAIRQMRTIMGIPPLPF